jgi:signal peptidase I
VTEPRRGYPWISPAGENLRDGASSPGDTHTDGDATIEQQASDLAHDGGAVVHQPLVGTVERLDVLLLNQPRRGDVVVFKLPKDNSLDYIKRVVGLPGDRIQMIHGVLYINGQPVQREQIENYNMTNFYGRSVAVPQYIETLPNGVKHRIIETDGDRGVWDDTPVYTVPAGDFFMMGDNMDDSDDSRDQFNVGYVPFENLVGKAEIIFFSVKENATLWRPWGWLGMVRWEQLLQHVG